MLESREITMKFGPVTALDHVSLKLEPGHIYAMLGPNGSGKTTWMNLATGLLKPAEGEMLWNGAPVGVESRREIAYMSTEPYFYTWMSIRQVGKYYQDFFRDYDPARFDALLNAVEPVANRLGIFLADHALLAEHTCMGFRTSNILGVQLLVDWQRCAESLREFAHVFGETA